MLFQSYNNNKCILLINTHTDCGTGSAESVGIAIDIRRTNMLALRETVGWAYRSPIPLVLVFLKKFSGSVGESLVLMVDKRLDAHKACFAAALV